MTESSRLRTILFADSVLAQPTFETLLRGGWIVGLCTSRGSATGANLRHLAGLAGIPIYEADRQNPADGLEPWLRELRPDVVLAIAFPFRLPARILSMPRLGAFNVHGGRLPQYRGPQPVFWQILNREREGAVTVHRMDEQLDRGAIVASQPIPIGLEDTYGLHNVRLAFAAIGAVEFLFGRLIQYGVDLPVSPQDEERAGFQRRPTLADLVIRWNEQSGDQIRGLVKASNPWNQGAFASIRGINLRLTDVTLREGQGSAAKAAGTLLTVDPTLGILVNCRDGSALQLDVVCLDEGIFPGRMLAMYGIQAGEQFAPQT